MLGIVGGLGPLAGAHFHRLLVEATPARADAEHLGVVLISDPAIPSRVEHLLGDGRSPVAALGAVIERLAGAGATLVAIPSTTTHAYYDLLAASSPIPIVHLLEALGNAAEAAGLRHPGVVGTTATNALRLLDPHMPAAIELRYPDDRTQRRIQEVIDAVKSGSDVGAARHAMLEALRDRSWDADGFLFACTETSLLLPLAGAPGPIVSAADVLAAEVLARAGVVAPS